jgi:LuxR family maltose regulon positive regulatory protein
VTVLSAPPGSGKTVLLRSWIGESGLGERAAWVLVGRDERDPQRFWLSVLAALRQTVPGAALVRALTAMPDLDGVGDRGVAADGPGAAGRAAVAGDRRPA